MEGGHQIDRGRDESGASGSFLGVEDSTLSRGLHTRISILVSLVSAAGPWASCRTPCVLLVSKSVKWGKKSLPCKVAALGIQADRKPGTIR